MSKLFSSVLNKRLSSTIRNRSCTVSRLIFNPLLATGVLGTSDEIVSHVNQFVRVETG